MSIARLRIAVLSSVFVAACAGPAPAPGPGSPAAAAPGAPATATAAASGAPDAARVYADLLGRTEDFPRVARAPKEYEGRSIVLYGVRAGEPRPIETRYSMPLASTDGRTTIAATERPAGNQFYLVLND